MGRKFTNATPGKLQYFVRDTADTMDQFTMAYVVYIDMANMNVRDVDMLHSYTSGDTYRMAAFEDGYSQAIDFGGTVSRGSSSGGVGVYPEVLVWQLLAMTKVSGSAAPRVHAYRWPEAAASPNMAHDVADTALSSITSVGAGGYWQFGTYLNITGSAIEGELAALGYWKRALSDREIERLVRGSWERFNPEEYWEYPTGQDFPALAGGSLSRNRSRQKLEQGTSRGARRDPPGFRFSINNRRR